MFSARAPSADRRGVKAISVQSDVPMYKTLALTASQPANNGMPASNANAYGLLLFRDRTLLERNIDHPYILILIADAGTLGLQTRKADLEARSSTLLSAWALESYNVRLKTKKAEEPGDDAGNRIQKLNKETRRIQCKEKFRQRSQK
ncbi:MAG: hypothetical protein MI923_28515 [Phycisphaerales bacterium]|nr:hypothetical protein [Phycisphaerales bacterium]